MNEKLDNLFVISLLLRQYSDFFSPEERENFNDEDIQYELFWNLLIEEGISVCELEWDGGAMAGKTWIKQIGKYYYIYDEIELYGPYESLDESLEENNSCRYISDAVKAIYINKPEDRVDWIIAAKDGHVVEINSRDYVVQDGKLI